VSTEYNRGVQGSHWGPVGRRERLGRKGEGLVKKEEVSKSILVIDDETEFVNAVRYILEDRGFVVFGAHSASDAKEMLETIRPDLMLVDIMMPKTDGLTLIRELSAEPAWQHSPMVVVSALNQDHDKIAACQAGARGYLSKPFTSAALLGVVGDLLAPAA